VLWLGRPGKSVGDLGFFILSGIALELLAVQAVAKPNQFAQILRSVLSTEPLRAGRARRQIIELINFAHGGVFTLGAYVGWPCRGSSATWSSRRTASPPTRTDKPSTSSQCSVLAALARADALWFQSLRSLA